MSSEKQNCNVATLTPEGNISVKGRTYTMAEARELMSVLKTITRNAATASTRNSIAHTNIAKQMFESADNGSVFTVRIPDEHSLYEIRQALNVEGNGIVPVIAALMEFHKDNESLNIIIGTIAMGGTRYARYTGQFAHQLAQHTQEFLKIRCIYDPDTEQMGIFCRKTEFDISITFKGQLVAGLREHGEISFNKQDIPDTYLDYPSMLLYTVRRKLPEYTVELIKQKRRFKFTAKRKDV